MFFEKYFFLFINLNHYTIILNDIQFKPIMALLPLCCQAYYNSSYLLICFELSNAAIDISLQSRMLLLQGFQLLLRANLKPTLLLFSSGLFLSLAVALSPPKSYQHPPLITFALPDAGPAGFFDEPDSL